MDFLIIATWRLTWSHHTAATTLTAADFLMIDQHFLFLHSCCSPSFFFFFKTEPSLGNEIISTLQNHRQTSSVHFRSAFTHHFIQCVQCTSLDKTVLVLD